MEHFDWITGAVIPYINFFIFLTLAVVFFRKPLSEGAKKKRAEFQKSIEEAGSLLKAAQEENAKLSARISQLDKELNSIVSLARNSMEQESKAIVTQGETLAKHIEQEAVRIAQAEIEASRQQIRHDIVDAVCVEVAKMAKDNLTAAKQKDIVKNQISNLKAAIKNAEGLNA